MESPTAATDAGLLSQAGVGFAFWGAGAARPGRVATDGVTAGDAQNGRRQGGENARERWPCLRIRLIPSVVGCCVDCRCVVL
ncbi:hypothetical protein SALBM311S_08546 [Streptomyces alboniger]